MKITLTLSPVVWSGELLPLLPNTIRVTTWHTCDLEEGEIGPPPAHITGCYLMPPHLDPVAETRRWRPNGLLPGEHVVIDRAPPPDTTETTLQNPLRIDRRPQDD